MKQLTLIIILLMLCNNILVQAQTPRNSMNYQVIDISDSHKIKINDTLIVKGQTLNSYEELQFSNCITEFVLISHIIKDVLLKVQGKCGNSKIEPYIIRIPASHYMGAYPIASILLKKFTDEFAASDFIEDLINQGQVPFLEYQNDTINVGIESEYQSRTELTTIVSDLKKKFSLARVIKRQIER